MRPNSLRSFFGQRTQLSREEAVERYLLLRLRGCFLNRFDKKPPRDQSRPRRQGRGLCVHWSEAEALTEEATV
jgi:hypothetical protein